MKNNMALARSFLAFWLIVLLMVFKNCDCSDEPSKVNVGVGGAKTSGSATISLNELNKMVSGADKQYVSVSFSGNLESGTEGTGETSFTTQKTIEVTSTAVKPVPSVNRYNLKPGTWKMTVSTGTWSASCTKAVAADASASFVFRYNSPNCQ
ncbi:MAG: hypothetical protein R6V49_04255 [Bacteroidales bacterium]